MLAGEAGPARYRFHRCAARPQRKFSQDVRPEDEVVAFRVLVPECNKICGIEIVRGPFALDGYWSLSAGRDDRVNLVPALVSPIEHFPALRASHNFIQYEMLPSSPYLAGSGFYRSRHLFNGNIGVNTVPIQQIDRINPESLERGFSNLLDVLRPAIQSHPFAGVRIKFEPELRGDHDFPAEWSECFAHQFFVRVRPINFCSIEESDASFRCRPDDRNHLLFVPGGTVAKTHSHADKPHGRDFQVVSQFALLHCFSFQLQTKLLNSG